MTLAKHIRVLELREINLARVEYKGSFQGIGKAYSKLMSWAKASGYNNSQVNKTITIYHDDPNVVGFNNVRQSACMIIEQPIENIAGIEKSIFKPGRCVVGRYEISFFEFKNAWTEILKWVKSNNFKESTGKRFEVYQNNFNTHPAKKCVIDICIPIE